VVFGLAYLDALPARVTAAGAAGRQDVVKPPAPDGQAETRSIQDGVYSEAQAVRGDKAYTARCALCHKAEQFTGAFLDGWDGQTVSGLFEMIRTSMPEEDPGSLARQEYADIVAFLLKKNGLPAGPRELPSASSDLKRIIIGK
jgi:mono/diheme cytochrome c family protein